MDTDKSGVCAFLPNPCNPRNPWLRSVPTPRCRAFSAVRRLLVSGSTLSLSSLSSVSSISWFTFRVSLRRLVSHLLLNWWLMMKLRTAGFNHETHETHETNHDFWGAHAPSRVPTGALAGRRQLGCEMGGTGYQPVLGGNLPPSLAQRAKPGPGETPEREACGLVAHRNGQVARSTRKPRDRNGN